MPDLQSRSDQIGYRHHYTADDRHKALLSHHNKAARKSAHTGSARRSKSLKPPRLPDTNKGGRKRLLLSARCLQPAPHPRRRRRSQRVRVQPRRPTPSRFPALVRRSSNSARNGDPPGGSVNLSAVAESEPSTSCTTPVKTPRCQSDMYVARPPRSAPSSSALVRGSGNPPALGTQTCVPRDIKTEGKNAICRTSYRWNR